MAKLTHPNFFSESKSAIFFDALLTDIQWRHEAITIFGKKILQPRLTAWCGDPYKTYTYSGLTLKTQTWTNILLQIKKQVEIKAGVSFSGALLNQYRGGQDSMGWHSDNEKELGENPVIASVSLGATRKFKFRHRQKKELITSIDLTDGSLLLMKGQTQHHWLHSISKTARPTEPRINITFRIIK